MWAFKPWRATAKSLGTFCLFFHTLNPIPPLPHSSVSSIWLWIAKVCPQYVHTRRVMSFTKCTWQPPQAPTEMGLNSDWKAPTCNCFFLITLTRTVWYKKCLVSGLFQGARRQSLLRFAELSICPSPPTCSRPFPGWQHHPVKLLSPGGTGG